MCLRALRLLLCCGRGGKRVCGGAGRSDGSRSRKVFLGDCEHIICRIGVEAEVCIVTGKQVPSMSQSSSGSNTVGGQVSSAHFNPENLFCEHHDGWVAAIDRLNKK